MKITCRAYECEDDFWRMRAFLREVFVLNNRLERSWHVARLDYARWHSLLNVAKVQMQEVVFLWEADGDLVGFVMPDGGKGESHLCVHPLLRTRELEEEMLSVAEKRLVKETADGKRTLRAWSPEQDELLKQLLVKRGYSKTEGTESVWRRNLDEPIAAAPLPEGYTIRPLGDGIELLERCYASGLGFHQGDIRIAVDNRNDPGWYRNIQTAPLYRRDLDLIVAAPDGSIAAFCTIWFDDVTRSGYFEPVATVPAHQKRGLGKAVMTEGLRRLQRMGCTLATVAGGSPRANALYRSVMGPEHELYEPWVKEWAGE